MKILSIDTASDICGVSILDDDNLLCKLDTNMGRTHSENLMPLVSQAFDETNLTINNIDLLVCDKGPGSFTGIRIGISTVKAFHDVLNIPCISVSSLEALAYSIKEDGLIASIIDCKNNNCYFALYEQKNNNYIELIAPSASTITGALNYCKEYLSNNNSITFVGDGSVTYKDTILAEFENATLANPQNNILDSYLLALAGLNKAKENKFENDLLPLYLRKPQAQRQLEEQLKNINIDFMTLQDLEQISNILQSSFDEFWTKDIFKDELMANNSIYLVAKFNQQIVGFCGIKMILEEANVMNIVVKKDFRNQGIGTLLLEKLIQLAKEKKSTSITLEVNEENYPAIHLYKKLGFKQMGNRKNYYDGKDGYIMTKN